MRSLKLFFLGISLALLGPSHLVTAANVSEFINFSAPGLPGRLFVPPEASLSGEARPLVLHLHGGGVRGTDNVRQVLFDIDNLFDFAKMNGAFFYAPQASGTWNPTNTTSLVMDMVDQAIATYAVDPSRIYIAGFSMGGGGTWNMLNRFPDRFAAAVPVAGIRPGNDFEASNLVGIPTWSFHARNDNIVAEQNSQRRINDILSAAGEQPLTFPPNNDRITTFQFNNDDIDLRYTEWPTGGHAIWNRVYADSQLREWLFTQSLAVPEPSSILLLCSMLSIGCLMRFQSKPS